MTAIPATSRRVRWVAFAASMISFCCRQEEVAIESRTAVLSYPLRESAVHVELRVRVPKYVELRSPWQDSRYWGFHAEREYFRVSLSSEDMPPADCSPSESTFLVPTRLGVHRLCARSIESALQVGDVQVTCGGEWRPGEASFDWMWPACFGMQVRVRPMTFQPSTPLDEVVEDRQGRWRVRAQLPEYYSTVSNHDGGLLAMRSRSKDPTIMISVFVPEMENPAQMRCFGDPQWTELEYIATSTMVEETCIDPKGELSLRHESRRGARHVRCRVYGRDRRLVSELRKVCDTVSVEPVP